MHFTCCLWSILFNHYQYTSYLWERPNSLVWHSKLATFWYQSKVQSVFPTINFSIDTVNYLLHMLIFASRSLIIVFPFVSLFFFSFVSSTVFSTYPNTLPPNFYGAKYYLILKTNLNSIIFISFHQTENPLAYLCIPIVVYL